jgi:hypothetical protein
MNTLKPSPKTRPIGPDSFNQTVTVPMVVARLFDKMAKAWRTFKNPMLRIFIVAGARAENHPQAEDLRRAMGVPSIHDPLTPEQKAALFEMDLRRMRVSRAEDGTEVYIKAFTREGI